MWVREPEDPQTSQVLDTVRYIPLGGTPVREPQNHPRGTKGPGPPLRTPSVHHSNSDLSLPSTDTHSHSHTRVEVQLELVVTRTPSHVTNTHPPTSLLARDTHVHFLRTPTDHGCGSPRMTTCPSCHSGRCLDDPVSPVPPSQGPEPEPRIHRLETWRETWSRRSPRTDSHVSPDWQGPGPDRSCPSTPESVPVPPVHHLDGGVSTRDP